MRLISRLIQSGSIAAGMTGLFWRRHDRAFLTPTRPGIFDAGMTGHFSIVEIYTLLCYTFFIYDLLCGCYLHVQIIMNSSNSAIKRS